MQPLTASPAPKPREPVEWEHFDLWRRVRRALFATPDHFTTAINLEGLSATDIFTLNTPLGATIEDSFVKTLNMLRPTWDPNSKYRPIRSSGRRRLSPISSCAQSTTDRPRLWGSK